MGCAINGEKTCQWKAELGCDKCGHNLAETHDPSELDGLLAVALKTICLAHDYVGGKRLPAVDGEEWYEAGKRLAKEIPTDEAAMQFAHITGYCPVCHSDTGIKIPRGMDAYCEDCGWPDEDFAQED